jgi:5-methylcytosine-specific restriction endonuclease McrA
MRLKEKRPMKYDRENDDMLYKCQRKLNKTYNVMIGCNEYKPDKEFNKNYMICKECEKVKKKLYNKSSPEKLKLAQQRRLLKSKLTNENWTKEDFQKCLEKFNHTCFNCGSTKEDGIKYLVADHNQPLSLGYPISHENAVLICNVCNGSKGSHTAQEFYSRDKLNKLKEMGINLKPKRYKLPTTKELNQIIENKLDWTIEELIIN